MYSFLKQQTKMTFVHSRTVTMYNAVVVAAASKSTKRSLLLFCIYFAIAVSASTRTNHKSEEVNSHATNIEQQQGQGQRQLMDQADVELDVLASSSSSSTSNELYKQNVNEYGETEVYSIDNFDSTFHSNKKLLICQGDCNNDSDCFGTLKCYQRYNTETVVGCYGYNDNPKYYAYDFCYDPLFIPIIPTSTATDSNTAVATSTTTPIRKEYKLLQTIVQPNTEVTTTLVDNENLIFTKCQGHCLSDDNCLNELKCMIRDNTKYGSNDPVPGCTGLRLHTDTINYCYNPDDSVGSYYANPENLSICLYQADFEHGTVIIRTPGIYTICENIQFCPNVPNHYDIKMPDTAYDPIFPSDTYDEYAFALGFHSAISIVTNNVIIDLNTYSIKQCESFSLMQRFFTLIELNLHPFINNTGSANFVGPFPEYEQFQSASNITIKGPGTLGRSTHNSIHGNYNNDITIKDIIFEDFEVAAVGLNRVQNLLIENCHVKRNRQTVPVVGKFSAARYIRPYIKYLMGLNYTMKLNNVDVTANELFIDLIKAINTVYNDVLGLGTIDPVMHPEIKELFENPHRVIDGPCYAFVIHGNGPAIDGFGVTLPTEWNHTSINVTIRNNKIQDIKCFNDEVLAAVEDETVMKDVRGSVFQFYNTQTNKGITLNDVDGSYVRNIIADCQIMVAKATMDGVFDSVQNDPMLITAKNTISADIVKWAEGIPTGENLAPPKYQPKYRCNGDAMHHVTKGMVVIRLEQTIGYTIENNTIDEVVNLSKLPYQGCTDYHVLADSENANQTQIAFIRGISIAGSRSYWNGQQSVIKSNVISNFQSVNSPFIVGIDIQGDTSGVDIVENTVELDINAQYNSTDAYVALIIGESADSQGRNKTIIVTGNTFKHEELIQNVQPGRALRNRIQKKPRHIGEWHINARGLSEQQKRNIGGCPLGYN